MYSAVHLNNFIVRMLTVLINIHFFSIGQKGCFVSGRFVSTDVLSRRTFCPYGGFVPTEVLSLRMFCPYGCFVPTEVLSHGCYVSGCFVSGRFVSGCFVPMVVLSPDVLLGTDFLVFFIIYDIKSVLFVWTLMVYNFFY
jgi:hypothetical protein